VEFIYASTTGSGVYHLVVRSEMETLCGLRVSRLKSQQVLHLVTEASRKAVCKHCERIRENGESTEAS
jgi:biotin operon repressor